jgi:crotonobetainyl-CoA:carnitine CoA-transferase CaiB-like acyl-CoA transferase
MNPSLLCGPRRGEFPALDAAPGACRALAQRGAELIRIDPPGGACPCMPKA